jgi:uncharacterized membrane protein
MKVRSRLVTFTAVISALTVVLSVLSMPFMFGTRIHFFQVGILLAGISAGPLSGLIAGGIGGLYVASLRGDPTILVGNGLLGLFAGIFARKFRPVVAGMAAWTLIQAPWIHVPSITMQAILMLLTAEDFVCACVVDVLNSHFHLRDLFAFGETSASST